MKKKGRYGKYGGQYVSETLMSALIELETAYDTIKKEREFIRELAALQAEYAGRETPLTFCPNASKELGCRIYLKREDLVHGGSHKLNNTLGQALLAKRMGKKRLIAETGAGQHGVATAIVGAALGMPVEVYMGEVDTKTAGAQCLPDGTDGGKGNSGQIGNPDAQGCHQRGAPRLGGKRTGDLLPDRFRCRPPPVSPDGPGLPVRDRKGDPRADT